MKNIFLSLLVILPLSIFSQAMDEDYLNSLPEAVRNDVISQIEKKENIEAPVYRRASSMIDKEAEGKSLRFGESFFDTMQTSFMPINEPNLDASYILDFGDVLEIQFIGQRNSILKYPIKRDGSVNIPAIGQLMLSGLSLNDASALIKSNVDNSFIGTKAFISLSNIRDIRILISGNAYNPGIYTLNGNSNMLHALSMAGGINDLGSYRDIELIRDNKVIFSIDLYDVIISGKSDFGKRLQSGDTILVKPSKKTVEIISGVKRPGLYEIDDEESFLDLIEYANGLSIVADTNNINQFTLQNGATKKIKIDFENIKSYLPNDGDRLIIREHKFNNVSIAGAVKNPGKYSVSQGTLLSDLIKLAGGYEDTAYPFAGFLDNIEVKRINDNAKVSLYNKFINTLIQESSSSSAQSTLPLILEQIRNAPSSGRVVAEFDLSMIRNDSSLDTLLDNDDAIMIPFLKNQVYVYGEVGNQGSVRYQMGKETEFYISNVGGSLKSADMDNIFIVHPNGQTVNLNKKSSLSFLPSSGTNMLIYPGSIIFVPRETDLTDPAMIASIWAPFVSSLALTITSLSVLGNQ